MYRNCPEHPDIAAAERTGYPRSWDWEAMCERHLMGHSYDGEGVYDDEFDCEEEIDEEEVYD